MFSHNMFLYFDEKDELVFTSSSKEAILHDVTVKKIVLVEGFDPEYQYTLSGDKAVKGDKIPVDQDEIDRIVTEEARVQYRRDRAKKYPTTEECVHALLDGGDTLTELQTRRQEVKKQFPKPE